MANVSIALDVAPTVAALAAFLTAMRAERHTRPNGDGKRMGDKIDDFRAEVCGHMGRIEAKMDRHISRYDIHRPSSLPPLRRYYDDQGWYGTKEEDE